MPSWNIHIAQTERLLAEHGAAALGVRDVNCFLFGNLVPDIYVGYMVKDPTRKIEYRETHFADPEHVPVPNHLAFWERYALPSVDAEGRISDMTLGAWAHLVADATYNRHVQEELARLGLSPSRELRIRKQGDFDLFGRTLDISSVPEAIPELLTQAAAFPQYSVDEPDVHAAIEVTRRIVEDNRTRHVSGVPSYSLLTPEFFEATFAEVNVTVVTGLTTYAARLA